MSDALRDQLRKAGLVDEKRLERESRAKSRSGQASNGKRKHKRAGSKARGPRGAAEHGAATGGNEQAAATGDHEAASRNGERGTRGKGSPLATRAERERDKARNRRLREERQALKAQVARIIDTNREKRDEGEIPYNFVEGKRVKRIWVTEALRDGLARGAYAVVTAGERYEVVRSEVAGKLKRHDPKCVVAVHDASHAVEEAAYPDRPIPDDLDW